MRIIDLSLPLSPHSVQNHAVHPPAGYVFVNQRHDITQHFFARYWKDGLPPLMDGLPESARTPMAGHGWQSEHLLLGSHAGAHIDAAVHYDPESEQDAASIPLESCFGRGVLLDLREVCDDGYEITADDLAASEQAAGVEVSEDDIVIINTGHAEKYAYSREPDRTSYLEKYPGFGHETARWLIDRKVKLVGTDTVNPDLHPEASTHVNLLMRGRAGKRPILIVENLAHLEDIPIPVFTFVGFPLPIVGASGSPIRAVALVDDV